MDDQIREDVPFFTKLDIIEDIQEKADALPKGVIMKTRGKFAHADKVTANGTLYERSIWEREIKNAQSKIEGREMLSLANHPARTDDGKVKPANMRDLIGGVTALEMHDDGEVWGEFEIADTDAGRDMAAMVRAGFKIGVSSRAGGTATKKVLDKANPLAEKNVEHIGREVNFINPDFKLRTFDAVVDQSVEGAKVNFFQEDKVIMEFDISKLTEENWKQILESEKVKAVLTEAVDAKQKEFDEKLKVQTREQVAEYMASDEFAARFEKNDDQEQAEKVECQECKTQLVEGMDFCGKCGRRVIVEGTATPDEKDATISELQGKLASLEEAVNTLKTEKDELVEERKLEKEAVLVRSLVEQQLEGKPAIVVEKVKSQIDFDNLKEEEVEGVVKTKIDFVEGIFKTAGFDPSTIPTGTGVVQTEEKEGADKQKPEMTESEKRSVSLLVGI